MTNNTKKFDDVLIVTYILVMVFTVYGAYLNLLDSTYFIVLLVIVTVAPFISQFNTIKILNAIEISKKMEEVKKEKEELKNQLQIMTNQLQTMRINNFMIQEGTERITSSKPIEVK